MIPTVTLKSGAKMPMLGLGTWRLFGSQGIMAIKKAISMGYTHIDTAAMYQNERDVGSAIEGKEVFLTTKVWQNHLHYDDFIASAIESTGRLGKNPDLLLIHWPNKKVPMTETFRAVEDLAKMGRIKSFGVSNFTITHLKEALNSTKVPICVNQVEFHPLLYQKELLEFCKENNIIITAYSPIARGAVFENEIIQKIAKKHQKTPSQISLRWLHEKGIVVIPRSHNEEHLKENLDIFDFSLDKDDTATLDNLPQKRFVDMPFSEFDSK